MCLKKSQRDLLSFFGHPTAVVLWASRTSKSTLDALVPPYLLITVVILYECEQSGKRIVKNKWWRGSWCQRRSLGLTFFTQRGSKSAETGLVNATLWCNLMIPLGLKSGITLAAQMSRVILPPNRSPLFSPWWTNESTDRALIRNSPALHSWICTTNKLALPQQMTLISSPESDEETQLEQSEPRTSSEVQNIRLCKIHACLVVLPEVPWEVPGASHESSCDVWRVAGP